jgi:hypothetical protein
LLLASGETLWSWSGVGIAALIVSLLAFCSKLTVNVRARCEKRYREITWQQVLQELGSALGSTLLSFPSTIAIGAWIILYGVAMGTTVYRDHSELVQANQILRLKTAALATDRDTWKSKASQPNKQPVLDADAIDDRVATATGHSLTIKKKILALTKDLSLFYAARNAGSPPMNIKVDKNKDLAAWNVEWAKYQAVGKVYEEETERLFDARFLNRLRAVSKELADTLGYDTRQLDWDLRDNTHLDYVIMQDLDKIAEKI